MEEKNQACLVEVEGMGAELAYNFTWKVRGLPDPFSISNRTACTVSRVVDHEKYCWRNTEWKGMELAELIFMNCMWEHLPLKEHLKVVRAGWTICWNWV